jgi:PAS domain S-box-containing protein
MTVSSLATPAGVTARLLAAASARDAAAALHRVACDMLGASASAILRADPASGAWQVESAAGHAAPRLGARVPLERCAALAEEAVAAGVPLRLDDPAARAPDLAALAGGGAAAVVGLEGGLLLLARADGQPVDLEMAACLGEAFTLARDRARTAEALAAQRDLAAVMDAVTRSLAIPIALPQALAVLCRGVVHLVDARRVDVWLHDRRARELTRAATSDAAGAPPTAIATADAASAIASALRHETASLTRLEAAGTAGTLFVPLRGRRRALGVLVAHGVEPGSGGEADLVARADAIGSQTSAILENAQLLDDVLRSRRELENVFDALVDLVAVTDARGRIVEANRPFSARAGLPREALIDQPLSACLGAELSSWVDAQCATAPAGPGSARTVVDDGRLGGRFAVTMTALEGVDRARNGYVLVARDITAETRLEADRLALERRLAQSEKLLALGQFVAGVAHELNNPLQGVLGHLELLRAQPHLADRLRRDLTLVYREADRAARIVRDLLVFAGSGRLRVRPFAVNALVTRTLRLRARAHRAARIEVARDLAGGLPRLKGDGLLLQQALLNLVLNAEQAMHGAGRLAIRTAAAGGLVTIAVEDSGPGLSPDTAAHVFEPFFTTKEVGQGTGLGLAIAYGVVRAHGGTIEAANAEAGGARFTIALPAEGRALKAEG